MAKKTADIRVNFRSIALSMPGAVECSHMGHPDFRAPGSKGRIFATLFCSTPDLDDEDRGMVKLTPEQQADFVAAYPRQFSPIKGAWGLRGCTEVDLAHTTVRPLKAALVAAWCNVASQKQIAESGLRPVAGNSDE